MSLKEKLDLESKRSEGDGIGNGDGPGPIPFDPWISPPGMVLSDTLDWVFERWLWFFGGALVLIVAKWLTGASIPFPLWLRVFIASSIAMGLIGYLPAKKLVLALNSPDTETVVEVDPKEGDLRVLEVEEEDWANVTFVNARGEQVDRSHLHQIATGHGTGYEVDWYDPESNTAQVSWMGGASNVEIRRHQNRIDDVRKRLSVVADQVLDLRANMEPTVRDAARETSMTLIEQYEGLTSVDGQPISEQITTSVSSNVSEFDQRLGDVEDVLEATDEELEEGVGGEPSAESDEDAAREAATDGGTESHE